VPEELLTRLQQQALLPACFALDPYADSALGSEARRAWLQAVRSTQHQLRQERVEAYAARPSIRLPADPQVRETLVSGLVDRDLAGSAWHRFLQDIEALLELAEGLDVIIEASGE